MSYYLFLDDARDPRDVNWVTLPENVAWVKARSYEDFVNVISKMGIPKYITYDCDLCEEHYQAFFQLKRDYVVKYKEFKTKCGLDCLDYFLNVLRKAKVKHPEFQIHTRNHYAGEFMAKTIANFNAQSPLTPTTGDVSFTPIPDYAVHSETEVRGFFGPYRFLSNFPPVPVRQNGRVFASVEVAYQSAKCANVDDRSKFYSLTASNEAKQLGKEIIIRPDWDSVKDGIMANLVAQKFEQEPFRTQLLETGDKYLEESNAWKDKYWGVYYKYNRDTKGYDNLGGQNKLGFILMDIREKLKKGLL